MPELQQMFNRHRKYILYLLSLLVLGWGFTPYKSIFLGLILGTVISFFNHWLLIRKTTRFGEAVAGGKKARSLGTLSRMAAAVVGVIIAMRYPEYFHIASYLIGLMASILVIMIDFILIEMIQSCKKREER